jgi:hypothetical protein
MMTDGYEGCTPAADPNRPMPLRRNPIDTWCEQKTFGLRLLFVLVELENTYPPFIS